jgi:hypothetical protein
MRPLRKPIWFLINGEARGHSELARQIYGEKFPQSASKHTFQCTNLCKRCATSSRFRAFEMNERDLGRQRGRILVAKDDIQERHFQQSF